MGLSEERFSGPSAPDGGGGKITVISVFDVTVLPFIPEQDRLILPLVWGVSFSVPLAALTPPHNPVAVHADVPAMILAPFQVTVIWLPVAI